jgi:hypothetical protein
MANSFLDKFRSGLKAVQSQQILSLISKERDRGSITTIDEFKARLLELTQRLAGTTISPTLNLYLGKIGDLIDSDSFNFMIERIEDDLTAAFSEANDIDEVLSSHESIINDVVLKSLELAINDLESKIDSLEFLNKLSSGFDNAIFNTFRASQNSRSAFNEGVVFVDPKTRLQTEPTNEASIDLIGEKLILKSQLDTVVEIASIRQIFDSEARASELPVETAANSLKNILDRTSGTYWSQSILLTKPVSTGVLTKLELNLGSVQTINYLQVEPFTKMGLKLFKIYYLDGNNQPVDILVNPIDLQTTNKFFFRNISTQKLIVVLQNNNYIETQFEIKPESPLVENTESIEGIRTELNDLISSPKIKSVLGLNTEVKKKYRKYIEYQIGIDNIEVGLNKFEETSLYLSKSEKVEKCKQVALKTIEKRSIQLNAGIEYTIDTQPLDFEDMFNTSLEYYLVKRDFREDGSLVNSFSLPLQPIHASVVRHERLILNSKSNSSLLNNDIGYLQFYTDETIEEFFVYRNGILLTPTDLTMINPLEEDGWLLSESFSERDPGQVSRMKIAIQIQQPALSDIYTVSYTPLLGDTIALPQSSTSPAVLVDLTGSQDAWLGRENIVYFNDKKLGVEIIYSLLNLVVVLRRNTSNVTLTPVLEEYVVTTGTKNSNKFGEV